MSAAHRLTADEFARIDRALGEVIAEPWRFRDFHVDFAMRNVDRLDRHTLRTAWSDKQWAVVEEIETVIEGDRT